MAKNSNDKENPDIQGLADLALRGAMDLMAQRVGEGFEHGNDESFLLLRVDTGGLWWTNASHWKPDAVTEDIEVLATACPEEAA